MLCFSTCWNNSRHTCGEAMIEEIVALGFDSIELSHGMTITKLPGIQKAFKNKRFRCVGVHNYFPAPVEVMIDAPDAYEYTSDRPYDRKRAMDLTLKTLETSANFEAQYLVLHMGSVPMPPKKWTKPLTQRVEQGEGRSESYAKSKIEFMKKRESIGPKYFDRAIDALGVLADRALELGVTLAVESRSRYEDMPTEREMLALQTHFMEHAAVKYWHDFGHVQLKHNLGLLDHALWLESIQNHLLGAHLHDVEWPARDHRVPLFGSIPYDDLLPFFPKNCPFTWELSPTRDAEQIRQALSLWKERYPHTLD